MFILRPDVKAGPLVDDVNEEPMFSREEKVNSNDAILNELHLDDVDPAVVVEEDDDIISCAGGCGLCGR